MQTGRQKIQIVILKGRHLKNKKKQDKQTKKQLMHQDVNYPFVFYPKENTT